FRGYQHARTAAPVGLAAAALDARGIEPQFIRSGGAADANVFVNRRPPGVNIANGTQYAHQPNECVTIDALETMLDVTLELVGLAPCPSRFAAGRSWLSTRPARRPGSG